MITYTLNEYGLRNKDIAEALGTTIRTVESQREALMHRLGIKSVAGLTKHAIRTALTRAARPPPGARPPRPARAASPGTTPRG